MKPDLFGIHGGPMGGGETTHSQERRCVMHRTQERTRITILSMLLALFGASALMAACNTTEGFGKDVEAAGDAIADTADDAKD